MSMDWRVMSSYEDQWEYARGQLFDEFYEQHGREPTPVEEMGMEEEISERVEDNIQAAGDYYSDLAKGK